MKRPRSSSTRLDQLGNDEIIFPSYPRQLFKHRPENISSSLDDLQKTDSSLFSYFEVSKCNSLDAGFINENKITSSAPIERGLTTNAAVKSPAEVQKNVDEHKPRKEIECSDKIEKMVNEITQKLSVDLAAKDNQITALQQQLDERSKKFSSDILLATKKEVDLIQLIKTKDNQIQDLNRQLLNKSAEVLKERKAYEEALTDGKEYRHICRRLEHKLEKLQKKYSDAVGKEKAMRASLDSYATQRDGEYTVYIDAARSKDMFDDDATKSLKSSDTNYYHRKAKEKDQLLSNNKRISPEKANEISAMRMLLNFSEENKFIPMSVGSEPTADNIKSKQLLIRRLCEEHKIQSTNIFEGGDKYYYRILYR